MYLETLSPDINLVTADKKHYLPLLLLADEQESMIDRHLERGEGKGIREIPASGRTIPK